MVIYFITNCIHIIQKNYCASFARAIFFGNVHKKEKQRKEIATAMSKLMKKKGLRTFLIVVLVIIAFVLFFKLKGSSVSDNSDKYAGVDFDTMSSEYQREGQYSDYAHSGWNF